MKKETGGLIIVLMICILFGLFIYTLFVVDARSQEIIDLKDQIAYRDSVISDYREEFTEMETAIEIIMDLQRANKKLVHQGIYIDMDGNVFYQNNDFLDEFQDIISGLKDYVEELELIIATNEILVGDEFFIQLWSDVDDSIEVIVHYFRNTDQNVSLDEFFETNFPDLYERIMGYDDLYYDLR